MNWLYETLAVIVTVSMLYCINTVVIAGSHPEILRPARNAYARFATHAEVTVLVCIALFILI